MTLTVVNIDTLAVGPVQAHSSRSFTSSHSLVGNQVSATVRDVNSRRSFEFTSLSRFGINIDALQLTLIAKIT